MRWWGWGALLVLAACRGAADPSDDVKGQTRDRDHDGIPDYRDLCPDTPEDFDGYQDKDGCPDVDNDNDGVHDRIGEQVPRRPHPLPALLRKAVQGMRPEDDRIAIALSIRAQLRSVGGFADRLLLLLVRVEVSRLVGSRAHAPQEVFVAAFDDDCGALVRSGARVAAISSLTGPGGSRSR